MRPFKESKTLSTFLMDLNKYNNSIYFWWIWIIKE